MFELEDYSYHDGFLNKFVVDDFYDAIELEDDKEAVRMALNANDIIELSPSDLNSKHHNNNDYQSPKRARLNINYAIGTANNDLEKQIQHQNIKQIKVQQHQPMQQHQHSNQHIVVQKIQTTNIGNNLNGTANGHFQSIATLSTTNPHRRKMQLVNRIA